MLSNFVGLVVYLGSKLAIWCGINYSVGSPSSQWRFKGQKNLTLPTCAVRTVSELTDMGGTSLVLNQIMFFFLYLQFTINRSFNEDYNINNNHEIRYSIAKTNGGWQLHPRGSWLLQVDLVAVLTTNPRRGGISGALPQRVLQPGREPQPHRVQVLGQESRLRVHGGMWTWNWGFWQSFGGVE